MKQSFLLKFVSGFFLVSAAVTSIPPTIKGECDENGLCFVKHSIKNSSSEVGFAFPPSRAGTTAKMLVSMKVQLPYGYAGIVPAQKSKHANSTASRDTEPGSFKALSVLWSVAAATNIAQLQDTAFVATMGAKNFVIQVSEQLPNQTFAPTGVPGGISTSSNIFFMNTSFYHIITRVSGSAMTELGIQSSQDVKVDYINSMIFPTYINNATPPAAIFDGTSAEITLLEFDGRSAQFKNYTEMLKVAGLT